MRIHHFNKTNTWTLTVAPMQKKSFQTDIFLVSHSIVNYIVINLSVRHWLYQLKNIWSSSSRAHTVIYYKTNINLYWVPNLIQASFELHPCEFINQTRDGTMKRVTENDALKYYTSISSYIPKDNFNDLSSRPLIEDKCTHGYYYMRQNIIWY